MYVCMLVIFVLKLQQRSIDEEESDEDEVGEAFEGEEGEVTPLYGTKHRHT